MAFHRALLPSFLHFTKPYFEVITFLSISDVLQNLPGIGVAACEAGIVEPVIIRVETSTAMKCFPPMRIFLLKKGQWSYIEMSDDGWK